MPGNPFAAKPGNSAGTGSNPFRASGAGAAASQPKKKKSRGGILGVPGAVGHVLSKGLGDLETAAVNSPGGIYLLGKAASHDTAAALGHLPGASPYAKKAAREPSQLKPIGKATVAGFKQDIQHPLRHPGLTALDVLGLASLGAGTAARTAAVAGRISEGARASEIASAALKAPKPGVRVLKVPGMTPIEKPASRSALTRGVTRQIDALRNRFPDARLPIQSQYTRVGRELARQRTHEYRLLTTPFEELKYAGRRIHPNSPRGRALRAAAEGTPLEDVIRAAQHDLANAGDKFTRKQLTREIRIAREARKYVNNQHVPGRGIVPVLSDPKLQAIHEQAQAAAGLEDVRMLQHGQITPEQIQTGIQGPGRIYKGAKYVSPRQLRRQTYKMSQSVGRLLKTADKQARQAEKQLRIRAETRPAADALENLRSSLQIENDRLATMMQEGFVTAPTATKIGSKAMMEAEYAPLIEQQARVEALAKAYEHAVTDSLRFHEALGKGTELAKAQARLGERIGFLNEFIKTAKPGLKGHEDYTGGVYHVGQETRRKSFSVGKQPVIGSPESVGIPRGPGRLNHALTGASIHSGGLRHDVPRLVAENALESERHAALLRAREFFIEHAQDTPEGIARPVPIRLDELKNKSFPEPVRALQDAYRAGGSLNKDQTSLLGMTYDTLRQRVFPKPEDIGFPQVRPENIPAVEGVKWIDERLLGGLNKARPLASALQHPGLRHTAGFVDAVNNATKLSILYLKPAYAVPNMLGNTFLVLTQQGVFAPGNLSRSVRLAKAIGPENARLVDRLMGEGISHVLSGPEGQGIIDRATTFGSNIWSKPVDLPFRRASFLFEARKAGYGSKAKMYQLLHDEAKAEDLRTVTQRATQAIIDYGDLTPVEQDIIRRVLFFYPWLKGSTRYAKTYLTEHPQQAAVLGALGRQGKEAQARELGAVPPFGEGLFKVGERNGMPLVSNPVAAGILGQPADLAAIAQSALSGHVPRGREVSSLLTPFLAAGSTALSGYDAFTGRPVEPNIGTLLHELTTGQPIPTLVSRLTNDQSKRMFPLTRRDALLQFLFGGLAPRPVNPAKLRASAKRAYEPRSG